MKIYSVIYVLTHEDTMFPDSRLCSLYPILIDIQLPIARLQFNSIVQLYPRLEYKGLLFLLHR